MAGCAGDYGHSQRLDRFIYEDGIKVDSILGECDTIVLRRSIPYSSELRPDVLEIGAKFLLDGFEPYYIVTIRDLVCNAASKINMGHGKDLSMAKKSLIEEWLDIGIMLTGFDKQFYIILTSCLFMQPERALHSLESWLGFHFPDGAKKIVFDADAKYYDLKGVISDK